jgi:hypothetical protein
MPIGKSPLNNKPEKKDYKQEFLDMVAQQSGPLAAATMEQAFKHQDTQLEEAMTQGGATIHDVSQIVAKQVGMPPEGGTEPTPEGPASAQKKGNFWYTPFSIDQKTGQVTPASMLGGLISQSPKDTLAMAQAQSLGQKNNAMSPEIYSKKISEANKIAPPGYQAEQDSDGNIYFRTKPSSQNDMVVSLKESQRQDRLEQNAIQRLSSVRGDTSIARVENQRDAAITAYNRISELESQGETGLNPVDYTDILGQLYRARTGVAPTEQILQDIRQNTAQGNLAKAYTFATGKQAPTSTADITKSLKKMAESFGKQADQLHDGYIKPHLIKPAGLDEERWDNIKGITRGVSFEDGTKKYTGGSSQDETQQGWTQEKESRYQELLKKRGK